MATTKSAKKSGRSTNESGMEHSKFIKLFTGLLKDIYWAEKALVKALSKMKKAATSPELQAAFEEHKVVTQAHVSRLEQVFELMNTKAVAKKCAAMAGLIEEGNEMNEETEEDTMVRDAGLIIVAQKIEHYEIASYGSLRTLAAKMGQNEIADLLQQTLDEEKEADMSLTELAESYINEEALEE